MDKSMKIGKYFILVADTESDTTTGAMTSIQFANVYDYKNPYPISVDDACLIRCKSTKEGMEEFHSKLLSIYNKYKSPNFIIYIHNLKWDISFWLNWLMKDLHYTHKALHREKILLDKQYLKPELGYKEFDTLITNMGQVFTLKYSYRGLNITLQDSLKIIPFELGKAGESYNTKFKKIKGENYDAVLSDEYCLNDVLCLSELVSIQISQGIDPRYTLSLASWCLKDFKQKILQTDLGKIYKDYLETKGKDVKKNFSASKCYRHFFPQLDELNKFSDDTSEYGVKSIDNYVRKAYKGGLTYCNPNAANTIYISRWFYDKNKDNDTIKEIIATGNYRIVNNISHLDVHSLYPSKCLKGYKEYTTLPVGYPHLAKGAPPRYVVDEFYNNKAHFIIRFKCKFNIKPNKFPSIQIKGSYFNSNDWLTTSAIKIGDEVVDSPVILTLTDVEFIDFLNRYDVTDIFAIDHIVFRNVLPCETIFNSYMGYYYDKKANTPKTDFVRYQTFKSKINNLTGKFGTNTLAGIKVPYLDNNGVIQLKNKLKENNGYSRDEKGNIIDNTNKLLLKNSEYTPIIAWITAYGRLTLLDEMDRAGTTYTDKIYITGDTDSLFVASDERFVPTLGITDNEINTFDEEHSPEDVAMICASRQKTYMMYAMVYNKKLKKKVLTAILKVAGMTEKQKEMFIKDSNNPILDFSNENINVKGGKLIKENTPDGAILVDTDFSLTEKKHTISKSRFVDTNKRRLQEEVNLIKTPNDFYYKITYDDDYRRFCIKQYNRLELEGNLNSNELKKAVGVDLECALPIIGKISSYVR